VHECASWCEAFDLGANEHIALVGGGGKTTTLWSLARELSMDAPTVVTSTTKAGARPPDVSFVAYDKAVPDHTLHDSVSAALGKTRLVAVGSGAREGRLEGVAPEVADELFLRSGARYVINEADGARMKPFKAPAEHEPVVASTTTLLIVVIGLDAIGAPIDDEHLHRPERIVELSGARSGAPLQASHVARIVSAYEAKCDAVDENARFAVLVNKVDKGPDVPELHALVNALEPIELSALVAASQDGRTEVRHTTSQDGHTKLWRLR
jgi:probable selenium-dependent hydroxylase accessory protein YqeC